MKNEYRKLQFILLIPCILLLSDCAKRKVTTFKEPMKFYFFNKSKDLELIKETKQPVIPIGKVKSTEVIDVIGYVEIAEKDSSLFYFEVICPPSLKEKCEEGKAFFESKFRLDVDAIASDVYNGVVFQPNTAVGTILGKSDLETLGNNINWLSNPGKVKSFDLSQVSPNVFAAGLALVFPNGDDRLKVINEILLLPELVVDGSAKDPRIQAVSKKYLAVREKTNGKPNLAISPEYSYLIDSLKSIKEKMEGELYKGFSLRSSTYKGLVSQFNKYKNHYLIAENLFSQMAKNGAYAAKGLPFQYLSLSDSDKSAMEIIKKFNPNLDPSAVVANGKVEFKGKEGVFLKITQLDASGNSDSDETLEIHSITAEESGGSIGFRLKLAVGELILTPLATTDYLLTSGQGFKDFLATLPKDYKEILKTNNYNKAVVLIAAKWGEGGYNEEFNEMRYSISTYDKYWMVYELVRTHPNIKRDKESSGTFVKDYGSNPAEGSCFDSLLWRQPKGEFYVSGIYSGCQGEGGSDHTRSEELCFWENGSQDLIISFPTADLRSDQPKVNIELDTSIEMCKYINILVFQSK